MPKISVIVPVYNVEKYLRECLDSIVSQTFKDIEIICVNDGSTDSSLEILNEYEQKDGRIKVLSQNNSGASAARNKGIAASCSPYITFVDADDLVDISAFEKMLECLERNDADYVYCRIERFDGRTGCPIKSIKTNAESHIKSDFFNENDMPDSFYPLLSESACDKMYKKDFIIKNNLYFPEGLMYEDVPFFARLYLSAEKISFLDEFFYKYRQFHCSSITQSSGRKHFDIFKAFELRRNVFKKFEKWEKYKTVILLYEIKKLFLCLALLDESLRQEFVYEIKKRYYYEDLSEYNKAEVINDKDFSLFVKLLSL